MFIDICQEIGWGGTSLPSRHARKGALKINTSTSDRAKIAESLKLLKQSGDANSWVCAHQVCSGDVLSETVHVCFRMVTWRCTDAKSKKMAS